MTVGPKTFAPFLATALVLWPIMAYMGAQGFSASIAVAALLGLFYVRVESVKVYAIACIAFAIWVVASTFWAPETEGLLIGNVFDGSLSLDMPGIRFGLTALAGLGVLVAVSRVNPESARISLGVIVGVALVQFIGVVLTGLFKPQILAALAPISDPISAMPQNLIRNANAFALLMPFFLAWVWHRRDAITWRVGAAVILAVSFGAFSLTGSQTAMTGSAFMLIGMAIVNLLPKNGFKVMFSTLAAYIVSAPLLIGWGLGQLRSLGIPLPRSFFSRSYSWELTSSKIKEAPIIGHGPEASHDWQDTFAEHPEWLAEATARYGDTQVWEAYRVLPLHPHNMPLQVWAETGMVGAVLAAMALAFLGWRFNNPQDWPAVSRYAAAGLIGMCFSVCSFAYSMWNEAYWASAIIAAAVILLQARHQGRISG
jgi:O-antigen ligase